MANSNAAANLDDDARSRGGSNSGGNFKNDPERAAKEGEKGGRAQSSDDRSMNEDLPMEDEI